jgi:hypothetical protein
MEPNCGSWQKQEPMEPIVGDILLQRNEITRFEWKSRIGTFFTLGASKIAGHQRNAQASSYQRESTIVLIRLIDDPRAYSACCQKLHRTVEALRVSSHDEGFSVEIG